MGRLLFDTYLVLLCVSLLFTGHVKTQQALTLAWVLGTVWVSFGTRLAGKSLGYLVRIVLVSQLPGIGAAFLGLWSIRNTGLGEWPNGILELWVGPFMPFLELLPAKSVGTLSDVYLAACCVPFAIVSIDVVSWLLAGPSLRWARKLPYR